MVSITLSAFEDLTREVEQLKAELAVAKEENAALKLELAQNREEDAQLLAAFARFREKRQAPKSTGPIKLGAIKLVSPSKAPAALLKGDAAGAKRGVAPKVDALRTESFRLDLESESSSIVLSPSAEIRQDTCYDERYVP